MLSLLSCCLLRVIIFLWLFSLFGFIECSPNNDIIKERQTRDILLLWHLQSNRNSCYLRKKISSFSLKIKATFCLKAWSSYDSKVFHICFCPSERDSFSHTFSLFHGLSLPLFLPTSSLSSFSHTHTHMYSYANVWSFEINPHIKLKINLEGGPL